MKKLTLLILTVLSGRVVAQDQGVKPDSHANSCGVCDIFITPVKITCNGDRAQSERPAVTLARGMRIGWEAADQAHWSIKFRRSPCKEGSAFNQNNPSCEIGGARPGQYVYTIRLAGCRRTGRGTITVVHPDNPAKETH
jgi:hypothetical protein